MQQQLDAALQAAEWERARTAFLQVQRENILENTFDVALRRQRGSVQEQGFFRFRKKHSIEDTFGLAFRRQSESVQEQPLSRLRENTSYGKHIRSCIQAEERERSLLGEGIFSVCIWNVFSIKREYAKAAFLQVQEMGFGAI